MAIFQSEADALAAVQTHPLCAQYLETPGSYVVFYPDTYTIPGGASVPKGIDPVTSLTVLYGQLEAFWNAQRLRVAAT